MTVTVQIADAHREWRWSNAGRQYCDDNLRAKPTICFATKTITFADDDDAAQFVMGAPPL